MREVTAGSREKIVVLFQSAVNLAETLYIPNTSVGVK